MGGGGGRVAAIHGFYRYLPRDRVWFLKFSILKGAQSRYF